MKKTVLVSGGAGFIGSHVTVELIEAGYDVVVADNFSNCDRTGYEGVKKITGREDLPLVVMDFCDKKAVKDLFEKYPIDAVIHFAAFKAVGGQMSKELGITGEQMAARYLEDQGYVILDRNYRKGHKEVVSCQCLMNEVIRLLR